MNMVVRSDEGAVCLLVDEIGDVVEVPHDSLEKAPGNVSRHFLEVIQGVSA
jgi:purine-binding chemotaxis protein CheW